MAQADALNRALLLDRRTILAGGALVGTYLSTRVVARPTDIAITHFDLQSAIPETIGLWRTAPNDAPVVPDPDEQKNVTAAYEEALTRTYVRPDGALVMLVIAHGRSDSGLLAIHRAEVCYTAQGFSVIPAGASTLRIGDTAIAGTRLIAVQDERREQVVYWATVAGEQSDVGIGQKLRQLRAAWQGKPLDAFLTRASTLSTGDDAGAFARVDAFLTELSRVLPPRIAPLILGR